MSLREVNYNAVASPGRAKRSQGQSSSIRIFMVSLLAVFFVVLMTGLAAGVAMYQSVASDQLDTSAARMQSGLLASNIHANDEENSFGVGNGPEGRALVLTKQDVDGDRYEVRFYLYQGHVVQEVSVAGSAYTPERAQKLIASDSFDFELYGSLLAIRTDQGTTNIALRSYQGGAS